MGTRGNPEIKPTDNSLGSDFTLYYMTLTLPDDFSYKFFYCVHNEPPSVEFIFCNINFTLCNKHNIMLEKYIFDFRQ